MCLTLSAARRVSFDRFRIRTNDESFIGVTQPAELRILDAVVAEGCRNREPLGAARGVLLRGPSRRVSLPPTAKTRKGARWRTLPARGV